MTPFDYGLLAGLLGVMCAVLLLVLLLRPFEGEPMVKLHPEILDEADRVRPFQPISEDRGRELHNLVKLSDRRDVR